MSCFVQEQSPVWTYHNQTTGQKKLSPKKTNNFLFSWVNIFYLTGAVAY